MGHPNQAEQQHRRQSHPILVMLLIMGMAVFGVLVRPVTAPAGSRPSAALKILKFAAGTISAYGLHESGHALVAKLANTDLEWGLGTYNQPLGFRENSSNDLKGGLLNSAGLVTQAVCSEVILQDETIDPDDSFVRGMMFWNVFNPVIYALDYWFIGSSNKSGPDWYQGDMAGIEYYWGSASANFFAASVFALAIYQGYRFLGRQTWAPEWAKQSLNSRLGLMPSSNGGIMFRLEIDF